jgi:hypothetical protein
MEKLFKMSFLVLGISFFLGCGVDKPKEEVTTLNKEPVETSAEPKVEKPKTGLLHAPGNYVRNMVGNVDKAKKAAAVYENSALEHMDASESTGK